MLLRLTGQLCPPTHLFVFAFGHGTDGQTEPDTAGEVRDAEELEPLVPAGVGRVHMLGVLRLAQRLGAMVDARLHVDLNRGNQNKHS